MSAIYAFILGVVEGVTEFLPVSSTGHLILTGSLLGILEDPFFKTFEIVIQLGAVCAVAHIYFRKLLAHKKLFFTILAGFIPTALLGLLLHNYARQLLDKPFVVVGSLFFGGIVLLFIEKLFPMPRFTTEQLSYTRAAIIGLLQAIAFIPGVSRSGASILGGMLMGLSRVAAVEFSFLLALPTMGAATALDLFSHYQLLTRDHLMLLGVGLVTAYISALISIRWLLRFISTHSFVGFGVYRIFLAIIFFVFFLR